MIHVDLFSGVGMFAEAVKQAGIKTVAFAEIDPWCHKVLRKHHPDAVIYDDVRKISYERLKEDGIVAHSTSREDNRRETGVMGTAPESGGRINSTTESCGEDVAYTEYDGSSGSENRKRNEENAEWCKEREGSTEQPAGSCRRSNNGTVQARNQPTDVLLTGGFPCQDLSCAGKQAGITAERSGLWSEFSRIISDLRPRWCIIENVSALLSGGSVVDGPDGPVQQPWFNTVLCDLAQIGTYNVEWHVLPAGGTNVSAGAPHRRERVWIILRHVADTKNAKRRPRKLIEKPTSERSQGNNQSCGCGNAADSNSEGLEGSSTRREIQGRQTTTGHTGQGSSAHRRRAGQSQSRLGSVIDGPANELLGPGIAHHLLNAPLCRKCGNHEGHDGPCRRCWADGSWEHGVPRVATNVKDRVHKLKALGNGLVWMVPAAIIETLLTGE